MGRNTQAGAHGMVETACDTFPQSHCSMRQEQRNLHLEQKGIESIRPLAELKGPGVRLIPRRFSYWSHVHLISRRFSYWPCSLSPIRYSGNGAFYSSLIFVFCCFSDAPNLFKVGFCFFHFASCQSYKKQVNVNEFQEVPKGSISLLLYTTDKPLQHCCPGIVPDLHTHRENQILPFL